MITVVTSVLKDQRPTSYLY
nr:unnamed protein product [Callosobruchus analis]CAI5863128.1 unnamed protein product [Callosobruchus analis]